MSTDSTEVLQKEAGFLRLGAGAGKLFLGRGLRMFDDWILGPNRWVGRQLFKLSPNLKYGSPSTKPGFRGVASGKTRARYTGPSSFLRWLNDRMNDTRLERIGRNLMYSGSRDIGKQFNLSPRAVRNITKGVGIAGGVGVGGRMVESLAPMFWDGYEDSLIGKSINAVNTVNPFYWASRGLEFPEQYMTPHGLAMTAALGVVEDVGQGMVDAAQQGATQAIDSTADAMAGMSLSDRLGFLFAPGTAASRYREQAMDQLASTMQSAGLTSSGDADKDRALRDIAKTVPF